MKKSLNISLHTERDKEILGFLEDKPKTYIVRMALLEYIRKQEIDNQNIPEASTTVDRQENSAVELMNFE